MLGYLGGAAEKAGVTLDLSGSHEEITAPRQIVEELIYNLCDNAIKYNKPGGSVTVTLENADGHARLTVADTGIGIPREAQSRVFERFYRVDKSHSKSIGGTGLGLSIVKHAAQFLGAKIDLSSVPGEGTTITVTF